MKVKDVYVLVKQPLHTYGTEYLKHVCIFETEEQAEYWKRKRNERFMNTDWEWDYSVMKSKILINS